MGKLNLIDAAWVRVIISMDLCVFRYILHLIGSVSTIDGVEDRICFVQVDDAPSVACGQAMVIGIQRNRWNGRKLVIISILARRWLSQIGSERFRLQIPNFTHAIFKSRAYEFGVFGKGKCVNRSITSDVLRATWYNSVYISLNRMNFFPATWARKHNLTIFCASGYDLIIMTPSNGVQFGPM